MADQRADEPEYIGDALVPGGARLVRVHAVRSVPAELGHFVAEAVLALGYFREDAIEELTAIYAAKWPEGTSSTMLGRDAMHLLSEKGLAEPAGMKATTLRISFNVRRLEFEERREQWVEMSPTLQFWCHEPHACAPALKRSGRIQFWSSRPRLPLRGCDKEWCACGWDHVVE
jgi:hypothetical protein